VLFLPVGYLELFVTTHTSTAADARILREI